MAYRSIDIDACNNGFKLECVSMARSYDYDILVFKTWAEVVEFVKNNEVVPQEKKQEAAVVSNA